MIECPDFFGEDPVIQWAIVGPEVRPTGNTNHYIYPEGLVGPGAGLAICAASDGTGFFLLGCNSNWESITDTWHLSLEDAREQGEFEYEGLKWHDKPCIGEYLIEEREP